MATLGDLNPNLYKKSQLQLENEARAAKQAQQDAVNRQSREYIGAGVTPDQIRVTTQPKPFTEPGANLSFVLQDQNQYMGPVATMGQLNPALNQKSQLQLENERRAQQATAQPTTQQNIPGETDLMRQARERNQSMINEGITYGNQRSTTPAQYDTASFQAQSGYGNMRGGVQNIAPELFTGRVAPKVGTDTRKTALEQKVTDAMARYKALGGTVPDPSHPRYREALQAYDDMQNSLRELYGYEQGEGQQVQQQLAQQTNQLAGREASEMAQTLGNLGSIAGGQDMMGGLPSTGDQRFDAQIAMAGGMYGDEMRLLEDQRKKNDELTKNRIINSLWQTNISELGYQKEDLNRMTTDQLMSLAATEGLDLSKSIKDRLSAVGKVQIENEKLAQERELADVEMTRRQFERQFGRAIAEREDFNTQQDTKLRRMLGMFGGGQVQDLAGNMAVMDAQEKGRQALDDLRADYGDRMDSLGRQYTAISQTHTNNIRLIENDMSNKIEGAFANLLGQIDGYIESGVKNEAEITKAVLGAKKEYLKTYMDVTNKAADFIQKQNEQTFNQIMKLQEAQREEDKNLSAMYGVVFQGGRPALDKNGMEIPTFDNMKFMREGDKIKSEQEGIIYENGQPKLDSRGRTIPTLTARKLEQDINQFEQTYALNVAKFNQDAQQFGMNYALAQQKFAQDSAMDNAKFMMDAEKNGYDVSLVGASSTSFNGANAKYSPVATPDGSVQFNIRTGTVPPNGREQCGEFVNDALGMKVFGDSIEQKRSKITTQVPNAGSAFVQSTQGPYGHVGLIEAVSGTDSLGRPTALRFVDSNYGGNGVVQRGVMTISYDKKGNPTYKRNGQVVRIDGFTDGILPSAQREQARTGESQYGPQRPEITITGESARIGQQYGPERPVGSYKAEAPQEPVTPQQQFQVGNMLLTKRAVGGVGTLTKDQKADVLKLQDNVRSEPAYKQVFELQSGYQNVVTGAKLNNAQGDLAIVNGMAKLLDPTGVVRPEEFKTVEEAQGWFQKNHPQMIAAKFMSGERLSTETRNAFANAASEIANTKLTFANDFLKSKYERTAQFMGVPVEAVVDQITFTDTLGGAKQSPAREAARQALANAGYDTSDASIDLYLKNQ